MTQQLDETLHLALAELQCSSAAFKRKRNIDGIALLKKRIRVQMFAEQPSSKDIENFPLNIRCCGGCGLSTILQVKPSDSIETVKFGMWQSQDIPPHQQRLICGERELHDDHTLKDYNINKETELRMVLHLRGYNTDLESSYQQLGELCLDLAELHEVVFKCQRNVDEVRKLRERIETEIIGIQTKKKLRIVPEPQDDKASDRKKTCCGQLRNKNTDNKY